MANEGSRRRASEPVWRLRGWGQRACTAPGNSSTTAAQRSTVTVEKERRGNAIGKAGDSLPEFSWDDVGLFCYVLLCFYIRDKLRNDGCMMLSAPRPESDAST